MFTNPLVPFYKLNLIAGSPAAKAMERVCFRIDAAAWRVVLVKRAADLPVPVDS